MTKNHKLAAALVLVLLAIIALGWQFFYKPKTADVEDSRTIEEISANYQSDSDEILSSFAKDAASLNSYDLAPLADETANKMLELKVPVDRKEFHLAVVITLNRLSEGLRENDAEKVKEAIDEYNQIVPGNLEIKIGESEE